MSPGRQLGVLWGLVALALVAISPLAPRLAAGLPACPLKAWSGWPCPGCGTTRAALALAELDPVAAFAVSPLAAAGWTLLVAGGLVAGVCAALGVELPAPTSTPRRLMLFRLTAVAALLGNWLYLLARGG